MRRRVLVVDDHASFRRFAARLLEAGGFEVVGEAEDGQAALAAARRLRPELVVLDVLLPDMSGFDVAEVLGAEEPPPTVVLVSSRSESELAAGLERVPSCGFLAKSDLTAEALVSFTGETA